MVVPNVSSSTTTCPCPNCREASTRHASSSLSSSLAKIWTRLKISTISIQITEFFQSLQTSTVNSTQKLKLKRLQLRDQLLKLLNQNFQRLRPLKHAIRRLRLIRATQRIIQPLILLLKVVKKKKSLLHRNARSVIIAKSAVMAVSTAQRQRHLLRK